MGPPRSTTLGVAAGAAVALSAAAAGAYVASQRAADGGSGIVVFLEGQQRGIRLPAHDSLPLLLAAVEAELHCKQPRVWALQLEGKPELRSSTDLQGALHEPAARVAGVLLLVATADGRELSGDAKAAPALTPVPGGPKPLPLVGNVAVFLTGELGKYGAVAYNLWSNLFTPDKLAIWGDTVTLRMPGAGKGGREQLEGVSPRVLDTQIVTCDPAVVAELLARQEDFPKVWGRQRVEVALEGFAGNGLFTSSTLDHDWQVAHGLLPRGFNQIRIKNYFGVLLDKTRSFVSAWNGVPQGGVIPDVNDWLTCMTADAVTKAAMGLDMMNVEHKAANEPLHKFIAAFRYGLKAAVGRATVRGEFGTLAALNPFFNGKAALAAKADDAARACHEVVEDLLERTRKGEIGGSNSVLTAMLSEVSPSTGDYVRLGNIYSQVINLMIAGHETTAATLGFTLYYVSRHPEVEARLLAEIEGVLGERYEPRVDDIPKLVYTEACFREALRLHPPVGAVFRDAAVDTTLQGKWFVQRGQRIRISNVALQRREDQWGGKFGDVNAFNPDRFMPGAAEETGRHPNAFNPWGFGVRACIGSQFALWEAKIFLCMVLRCFKLVLPAGYVAMPSVADGGAAPGPHHLALHVYRRVGREDVLQKIVSQASAGSLPETAAAASDGAPAAAAPAAAGAGAPPKDAHNTPLLVLYGSNMGTCEELAGTLAAQAGAAGFDVTVANLDSAVRKGGGVVPAKGLVVIISSTYNGTPPDNASKFAKWLEGQAAGSLPGVTYAVFGVGNSQWTQTFQAFPKRVSLQLKAAGAHELLGFACCDVDSSDWNDAFDGWLVDVVRALLTNTGVTPPAGYKATGPSEGGEAKARLLLSLLSPDEAASAPKPLSVPAAVEALRSAREDPVKDGYWVLKVLENRELQGVGSDRSTRHVQLALPGGPAGAYMAGEHLEVIGNNDAGLVDAALRLLGMQGTEAVRWVTNHDDSSGSSRTIGGAQKLTLTLTARDVLTWLPDLSAVPSKRTVALLAEACPCPPEAAQLRAMASDDGYKYKVASQRLTLVELLAAFKSVPITLPQLANLLPRLAPRYYSISSSPLARPGTCSITVGKVAFTTPSGRQHKGAASAMIAAQPTDGSGFLVGCVRRLSSAFRLPADPATPIIMVGPGTGLAPMMGFLQERAALAAQGTALGPAVLFFGCRSAKDDFIYREELEAFRSSGALSQLHVAFSRDGATKVYVQDLIQAHGAELWPLFEAGAVVYVCGDARRMEPDVRAAFKDVARTWGGRSDASAESWMGGLLESNRYLADVWAG